MHLLYFKVLLDLAFLLLPQQESQNQVCTLTHKFIEYTDCIIYKQHLTLILLVVVMLLLHVQWFSFILRLN